MLRVDRRHVQRLCVTRWTQECVNTISAVGAGLCILMPPIHITDELVKSVSLSSVGTIAMATFPQGLEVKTWLSLSIARSRAIWPHASSSFRRAEFCILLPRARMIVTDNANLSASISFWPYRNVARLARTYSCITQT